MALAVARRRPPPAARGPGGRRQDHRGARRVRAPRARDTCASTATTATPRASSPAGSTRRWCSSAGLRRRSRSSPGRWWRPCAAARVLFINELNRMPESVQNVLLPALDEGLLMVPHIGEVRAAAGFQVVATQNPVEYVATGHLSEALRDRFEHLALAYQTAAEEEDIVAAETGCADAALVTHGRAPDARHAPATRRFRKGASVRARSRRWPSPNALAGRRDACGAVSRAVLRARGRGGARHARRHARRHRRRASPPPSTSSSRRGRDRGEDLDVLLAPADGLPKSAERRRRRRARQHRRRACEVPRPACRRAARLRRRGALAALAATLRLPLGELDGWTVAVQPHAQRRAARRSRPARSTRSAWRRAPCCAAPPGWWAHARRHACRERADARAVTRASWTWSDPREHTGQGVPRARRLGGHRREERRQQVVLMVDTSLSMSGENMALARRGDRRAGSQDAGPRTCSVVVFEDKARAISRLGVADPPEEVVRPHAGAAGARLHQHRGRARGRGRGAGARPQPHGAPACSSPTASTPGAGPRAARGALPAPVRAAHRGLQDGPGSVPQHGRPGGGDVFPVKSFQELPRACSMSPTACCARLSPRAPRRALRRVPPPARSPAVSVLASVSPTSRSSPRSTSSTSSTGRRATRRTPPSARRRARLCSRRWTPASRRCRPSICRTSTRRARRSSSSARRRVIASSSS